MIKVLFFSSEGEKKNWSDFFPPPLFTVEFIHVDFFGPEISGIDQLMLKNLISCQEEYTLILKDTCITNVSPKRVASILEILMKYNGWDICYLSDWLQNIDSLKLKAKIGHHELIYQTFEPHGIQALFLSPVGVKKVLKSRGKPLSTTLTKASKEGKIITYTLFPPLFNYHPLNIKSEKDIAKFSFFSRKKSEDRNLMSNEIFFIIVMVMIIMVYLSKCR
jgi:hypothetical protein